MKKESFINKKGFSPLDDLYYLFEHLEQLFKVELEVRDFVIGRQQLYFPFFKRSAACIY
jgi:hypothetical protein